MNEYYKASEVAKAIAAGVTAFVGTLGTALADGNLDGAEIGGIVAATLVAAGVVFRVPNKEA
jgi:hypothetical protein